jgi:hypothetical protein
VLAEAVVFAGRNIIPFSVAAVIDAALAVVVKHPLIVITITTVIVLAATLGRVALARWLLRSMGSLVVPVGLRRLRPARATPATAAASAAVEPVLAIGNRAPLAIEPPRVFADGEAAVEPAAVVINGTRYPVLRP